MSNDDYPGSPVAFRMAVLNRLAERDCEMTIEQLADETALSEIAVLYPNFHTPETMTRLCALLGWPSDRFIHLVSHETPRPFS